MNDKISREKLIEEIKREVENCRKCELHKFRRKPVIGEGNLYAKLMFIGEAPGYWEDIKGRPFVGAAGKLLDELLFSIGVQRSEIYIANILKCRPPKNRDPKPNEVRACTPYLDRQILIIKPKVIVTLGRHSTSYILSKAGLRFKRMTDDHGKIFEVDHFGWNLKIVPTFHPASALYNPRYKSLILKDLKLISKILEEMEI